MTRNRFLHVVALLATLSLMSVACGATPTPEPVTVRITADGSGDYANLETAVESVPAGSTIHLGSGTYVLTQPLTVDKPLRLVGAGMEETSLVSEAGNYVIRFTGGGPMAATEITFRHEGQIPADVVVVQDTQFAFARCRFTGAYRSEGEAERAGLRIQGSSVGVVQDSEASTNQSIGISVADQAQPKLERNSLLDNVLVGIAFEGSARGTATQNLVSGSTRAGILISGQAAPTLEDNGCTYNGTGIAYFDSSGGTALRNDCSANVAAGITVGNESRPTLEYNTCTGNLYGVAYAGSAGGVARANEISANGVGLLIGEDAQPELVDNNVYDNKEEDIRDLRP